MGNRVLSAALISSLLLAPTGPAGAIINGKPVEASDAYATSVVGVVPVDEDGVAGECTGILLSERAVLTAAHCVTKTREISVVFDLEIGKAEVNAVRALSAVVHPDFVDDEETLSGGDLAVLFLAPHEHPIKVIPLDADVTFTEGQQFVMLGYGRSILKRFRSNGVLRKAAIAATGHHTPREVELRPLANAWPCDGDSGGPVLRKDLSGRYAVSGVMSVVYSGPVGECLSRGSFMTPIHTYSDWIAETLAKQTVAQGN